MMRNETIYQFEDEFHLDLNNRSKASIYTMMRSTNDKNFFSFNIKKSLTRLKGLKNVSEIKTAKAIHLYDKMFSLLASRRGGLQQTLDQPIKIKFHILNWLLRILVLVLMTRLIVLIAVEKYDCDLYLANPFSGSKGAKKNAMLLFILLESVYIYGLREYTLLLEETGRMRIIRILFMLEKRGFNPGMLKMNNHRSKQFQKYCYSILINILINTITLTIVMLFIIIYLRTFHLTVHSTLMHSMFHIIYMFTEFITFFVLIISAMCSAAYLMVMMSFYIGRFNTITDTMHQLNTNNSVSCTILSELNYRLIDLLNDFGQWNDDTKFLFQYCVLFTSAYADFDFFIGLLYGLEPDGSTMAVTIIAISSHLLLFICSYFASQFYHKSIEIHRCYCILMSKTKLHKGQIGLKSMEILDRLDSKSIGVHMGNFGIFQRSLSLTLLLENASFIMLLSCNVRLLI
uniref:Gustatory receptor n=1 Tax=Tetranychus urticae TaxID=32264 RepID=T1JTP5_TETUR